MTGYPSKRTRLVQALANPAAPWQPNPYPPMTRTGCSARYFRTIWTPAATREVRPLVGATWSDVTFVQMCSILLVAETAKPLLRVCDAPWVEARTREITIQRALDVIADPVSVFWQYPPDSVLASGHGPDPLLDPDCVARKHGSCAGDPCECDHHKQEVPDVG